MKGFAKSLLALAILATAFSATHAGPIAYGICQTGCNALAVACYAAAGFTFGVPSWGAAIPATVLACNAGLGTCMAACVAAGLSPIP
ncbi:hypothetical protein CHLRE_03g151950v5 [Chlamydomonas reinhardtii]|uniref:Zygote-specific class V copy B gene protein n=1 Tax=Chlamydomonas reinhardtii TaxID=3055 RepID=Q41273_CHLRE|nr:uncharacterized protein CHLRE_03g151950v5 [Chlamydomonas reinhardtii]AAB21907.1 cysteine-rich protein [Chlamydomonas reinhardtii]PNW84627.1 hypothetical protein CHLRE_03g151950v5 [Chlamydomonas reinhardtii]|eukprot:XP_001695656.1 zygote-specific protein [Chlamydomonas reinhardtii]